jgi:hypothetical protein
MPWSNNPDFSIEDAIARGDDVYEVIFDAWGFRSFADPLGDYTNLQWPPTAVDTLHPLGPTEISLPSALAGIAIGPQSTVDRCWLTYNLGKRQTIATNHFLLTDRLRRLSVDSPILFSQAANPDTRNDPGSPDNPIVTLAQRGSLYIYPMAQDFGAGTAMSFDFPSLQDTTVLPQTFRAASGGAAQDFGGNVDGNGPILPKLHLYLYLKAPIVYAPQKRFPLQVQGTVGGLVPVEPGAERVIAQIPTFGRKSIHIMMISSVLADFRVGAFRAIGQTTGLQEQPVDQALAVGPGVPAVLGSCIQNNHVADYTNLYATVTAPGTVSFQLTAYD